ncbi:MAG: ATP-binding protein [Candidatus Njordarchaeales archaeon]
MSISKQEHAHPDSFVAWVRENADVEVGDLLVVEEPEEQGISSEENQDNIISNSHSKRLIIASVEDILIASNTDNFIQEYISHEIGNPIANPRTIPKPITLIKLRTILRSDGKKIPPTGRWYVRYPTISDIDTISQRIPENKRILAGFIRARIGARREWVPFFFHADFILGPEGAHININGKTGLATKTSYALFLTTNILKWAEDNNEKVAVILFNVKRDDFLKLHIRPKDWSELEEAIMKWGEKIGNVEVAKTVLEMWKVAKEKLDYDIVEFLQKVNIKYFTYPSDPDIDRLGEKVEEYKYGLGDLSIPEIISALYPEETGATEQQINMIYEMLSGRMREGRIDMSFNEFQQGLSQGRSGDRGAGAIRGAILRRLRGLSSRARRILEWSNRTANPIIFRKLEEGFNVIQLYGLSEVEKRIVVNAVVRTVSEGLARMDKHLDRVVIVMDELNKYAPKRYSAVKEQLIEIVARGRDLKLSLIGAQQFASEIDKQVYGNTSTKVVGVTDQSELKNERYAYLGGLRKQIDKLDKGELAVYHPLYPTPVLIRFPTPYSMLI